MKCPVCNLENPESARSCDCGHEFSNARAQSSHVYCSACDVEFDQPISTCVYCKRPVAPRMVAQSITAAAPNATKKCPFCAEDILAEAIKCKHCGETLSSTRRGGGILIAAGYLCGLAALAFLPPALGLAAFVIGVVNLAKGRVSHGIAQMILAVVCGAAGMFIGFVTTLQQIQNATAMHTQPSSRGTEPRNQTGPELEVIKWSWHKEYGYAILEGEVKNISSRAREHVEAVGTFYDADDGFIASSDAVIEYDPLLPGQTSPFKVMQTWNPAMKKANVAFKELLGGSISFRHAETTKK